ncbi:unnamed protein product [Cunninghamella echinulata]
MDESIESSPLYAVISFFVVWTDFIVRTYIRVKAVLDAVMFVAKKKPGKPTRSTYTSEINNNNNNNKCYRSTTIMKSPLINALPNEVLQLIFKSESKFNLYNYTLVCQRWHRVVTPILWKDPILPFSSFIMDPVDYCPSVSSSSSTLFSIPTDSSHDHSSSSTSSQYSRRSSLTPSIISHHSHQSYASSIQSSSRRSSVIYQQFNNNSNHDIQQYDNDMVALPMIILALQYKKYGYSVRSLHLSSIAHLITDDVLLYIIKSCPRLKSLDISNCQQITSKGYQYLARSKFASSLTQLCLSGCPQLSDSALVALSMRCESLESIHLAGCHRITQTGVRSLIAASRHKLKYINIKDCIRVSGRILQDIAVMCGSRLRGLDVTRICSILHHDMKVLVYHCPNIEQLYLGKNKSQLLCQLQHRIRNEQQQQHKEQQLPFSKSHSRSPSQQQHYQQQHSNTNTNTNTNTNANNNSNYIRSRTTSSLSTSLSSSLSSSLLHRQSRSSSLLSKPNALDSLIDMLRAHNVDPSPSSSIDSLHQPSPTHSDKLKQRTHRSRHLSQPTWNLDQIKNNNNSKNSIHQQQQYKEEHNDEEDEVSQLTVDMILKNLLNLKKVDFSYWTCLSEQGIRRLRQKGHTLQYIGLDGCSSVTQPPISSHKSGISDICKN